ncbi:MULTISPECIES: class I SAM-dependent methyltransferase [unclassified Arthrobacter]|uniref:class I SAM-dependent methyltransferase n=1 Tax=unclassified Arthrobacter TaxID=235627 RepID=UPI0024E00193|nr:MULTISPECIES: class I SAM-dependent methyltransferase [unclassified Arthrobacter]MCC9146496.1 class I SAM-dependent methyltransferase [Arthrobacter sp. zg-Y919]MDK1277726.1 class I SAM-dependent methyltransferase [Arthrobacter sp. zg.Y919]WIB02318.1 class I SAM-dependent methyltransferase [Arthrobacter sp. zg-Y919]
MGATGPRLEALRRRQLADSYQAGGEHYDRIRPGYPAEAVRWLVSRPGTPGSPAVRDVADVGAGTGKYTRELRAAGLNAVAVDPSRDMLDQLARMLPEVPVHVGTAEDTGLPASSLDAVTVAQAWHWCDPAASSREFARILRPHGVVGLVWNQLDVSVPWVHRYSRIIHAGDVLRPEFRPGLGPEFTLAESSTVAWTQQMTPEDLFELAKSRAFYLSAGAAAREKLSANLSWYLYEHLGHTEGEVLDLPYLTLTWRAVRTV